MATDRSVADGTALPFALCFYPHSLGELTLSLVARCMMGSVLVRATKEVLRTSENSVMAKFAEFF